MKKALFIFVGLILTINLFAQNCKLSPEANRYWIRATTAMNTITSDDDYKIAAEEFEKALQYAPQCGDILFNLALIYSQIGTKEGNFYFSKAEKYLETYKQLNPNDKEVEKLAIEIGFKREKFQRDAAKKQQQEKEEKLKAFEGTWKICTGDGGTNYWASDLKIHIDNGRIYISARRDNRGNRVTVEGYISDGFLMFEHKYTKFCSERCGASSECCADYVDEPLKYKLSNPNNERIRGSIKRGSLMKRCYNYSGDGSCGWQQWDSDWLDICLEKEY